MSKKEPKIVKTVEEKRIAKALAMRKYRAKLKEKDPEGFLAKQRYEKQKQREKKKGMNPPAPPADLPPDFYPAPPVQVPPPPKTPKPKKMKEGIPPPPPNKPKKPSPPPNKPKKKITQVVPPPPKTPKPKKMKIGIPPPPPNKPKKPRPPPNKPKKKITPFPKLKNISKNMQDELNLMYYDINKLL